MQSAAMSAQSAAMTAPPPRAFISFEWSRGLLPAQAVRAALGPDVPVWFALDHDAALPVTMEAGVRDAGAFVFFATDGCFTYNVRHEVACAVAMKKPVIVLHDADGPPLAAVLEQAATLLDAPAAASRALRHLDALGAAEFKSRALEGPVIEFRRDATLVSETSPALLRALGGPISGVLDVSRIAARPFKMRALRPLPGCCDALVVAAGDATLQALYIAEAARGACGKRALVVSVLKSGDAGDAIDAVSQAGAVILVLSRESWRDDTFVSVVRAALDGKKTITLVHEADATFSGVPVFQGLIGETPEELKPVYSSAGLAVPLTRGAGQEALFLGKLLPKIGCEVSSAPLLPPPPLPAGYKEAATAAPRAEAISALLASSRPSAVALGGLGGAGKTTVAASIAMDPIVTASFYDVVWVTVGKVDHTGVVGLLEGLIGALETGDDRSAEVSGSDAGDVRRAPLDPVAAMVQRLRAVCALRSVLIVVDDVWAPLGWAPDAASLLLSAVDVTPEDGGAPSMALFTARDTDDRIFSQLAGRAQRGLALVKMGALKYAVAATYVIEAAHLGSRGPDVTPILRAFGTLPLALTLAASCLSAEVEQDESAPIDDAIAAVVALQDGSPLGEGSGAPKNGAWLDSSQFCAALEHANEHWRESDYVAIYRAIQAALKGAVPAKHYPRFATFGLLEDDVYAPEAILSATWGMSEEDTRILLKQLQEAGLVKWEAQARRVVLHDLAHDFATAMAATQRGGVTAAHGTLVDRCGDALVERGEGGARLWWKRRTPEVDDGAMSFIGKHLLRHLREAGRGAEGTDLVWKLQWLIHGVKERGGSAVIGEVGAQLNWERQQGDERRGEVAATKLLHQALVMGAAAWVGEEGPGNVAPQIIGRLGGLEGGAGGERVRILVEEATGWDGGGRAWLRPVRPNFPPPGDACEVVLEEHTDRVWCVCALSDGRLASASSDNTVRVWDASSGACLRVLEGHTSWVTSLCALSVGRLASASYDSTVRVWDISNGACLETARKGSLRASEIFSTALSADIPAFSYHGRTQFHFAPWGVSPVYLGGEVSSAHLCVLVDGRRVAFAGTVNGHVHVLEVIEPC